MMSQTVKATWKVAPRHAKPVTVTVSTVAIRNTFNMQQQRGMATEKQLRTRLKSVTSIRKITKAMKMVAASKLRQVERLLDGARKFAGPLAKSWPEDTRENLPIKKVLYVPMTGDRGLCGAVNSAVVKSTKSSLIADRNRGLEPWLFTVGDKAKGGLERSESNILQGAVTELGKTGPPSFLEVSLIAENVLSQKFDKAVFVYNRYKSAIAYDTTQVSVLALKLAAENTEAWNKFEFEGDQRDVLQNLYEFRTAVMMFAWVIEGATSEQSARMTAMDNSTSNAGDMLSKIRLLYNRTRQARITTELIEIISGATAAEEMKKN